MPQAVRRVLGQALRPVVARMSLDVADHTAQVLRPELAKIVEVEEILDAEVKARARDMGELRRLLADQLTGDSDVTEALGRVLVQLRDEVEALRSEVASLVDRLPPVDTLR